MLMPCRPRSKDRQILSPAKVFKLCTDSIIDHRRPFFVDWMERLGEALQNLDLESVAAMCEEVLLQRETGNQ